MLGLNYIYFYLLIFSKERTNAEKRRFENMALCNNASTIMFAGRARQLTQIFTRRLGTGEFMRRGE